MAVNIHNLIGAICPDVYCVSSTEVDGEKVEVRDEVKKIAKEKGYLAASEKVKLVEGGVLNDDTIYHTNPFKTPGLKSPMEKHTLIYDSFGQNLEPIYFWILDKLADQDFRQVDKLIDNFISSPGSGHFSELGQKATKMQEEGMKMLGAANNVVKSILTLTYDLKEFKTRLDLYDEYNKNKDEQKRAALLSLKQIWMDTVDTKRSTTALKALAQQFQYVTLIDEFLAAESLEDVEKKLDLNDRVKRILSQRLNEFFFWITESERELRKRYEIEKTYLRSQVNTVYLYAKWAKPYLKAARQLEQRASPTAALVTVFNTTLFELALMGQGEYDPQKDIDKGDLPDVFKGKKLRKYIPIMIVEFNFRSVPERAGQQGYGFRGRVELNFTSYALSKDEVKILKDEIQKDDMDDVFKLIEGATTDSLEQIKGDIDYFLKDLDKESDSKDKKEKKDEDDYNDPFSALFFPIINLLKGKKKKDKKDSGKDEKSKEIKPDADLEKVLRSQAIIKARQECKKMYGVYKKEHEMPAF